MARDPAARQLIVNADDLGLHEDINRGIERAHREGIVTSTSLSAVGQAFEEGVAVCGRCPELNVGVHLTLVGERPLTDPSELGGLVTTSGDLVEAHPALVARVLSGRITRAAVLRELEAQVQKVIGAGIRPTHLDSHQHVHLLPRVWPVVVDLARRYGIAWVRVPAFIPVAGGDPGALVVGLRLGLNVLQRARRNSLGSLRSVDATPALGLSGHLTVEGIRAGLATVPRGAIAELVTHPGVTTPALQQRYDWGYDWTGETTALTDPDLRNALADEGFELRGFSNEMAA